MEIRKSMTPLPPPVQHSKQYSCNCQCYLTPDSCKMHRKLMEHSSKLISNERHYNQWRTLIGKQAKIDPTEKSMKVWDVSTHALSKGKEKPIASMEHLITEKVNKLNETKAKLEKLKEEYSNYKSEEEKLDIQLGFHSEECKQANAEGIYSAPEVEVCPETMDKEKMSLRLSSEHNRVMFNKVRPSLYKDKNGIPSVSTPKPYTSSLLSKSGMTMEKSSSMHKTLDDFALSKTLISKNKKTPNSLEDEMMLAIGKDKFNHLRYLFERYCAKSNPLKAHTMESHQFHKFLQENSMLNDKCTVIKADLLFCKGNKSKSINFAKFSEVLLEMAQCRYPNATNRIEALEEFLGATIFHRNNANYVEKTEQYEDWFIELENKDIIKFLDSSQPALSSLYKKYAVSSKLSLKGFTKLCQDVKIIADLLSHADCTLMFKVCQRMYVPGQDLSTLDYGEFVECLCFMSFYYYTKMMPKKSLSYLEKVKKFILCALRS